MELEREVLVSPTWEVPVIEGELVATIRELAGRGVGSKTIWQLHPSSRPNADGRW